MDPASKSKGHKVQWSYKHPRSVLEKHDKSYINQIHGDKNGFSGDIANQAIGEK